MIPGLTEYQDRQAQARALADTVARQLTRAIGEHGKATLCVPGGNTPAAFLRALAGEAVDWTRLTVLLNDERWVPPDHERSNARLLRETLLKGAASVARYVPLWCNTPTPEEGLAQLEPGVRTALPIDVLVLGMGNDGHTASLFPGADRLAEALDPDCPAALMAMRAPGAIEPRITLTLPVLLAARETHLLIAGRDKRDTLERVSADGPVAEAPVRAILKSAKTRIHFAT